jgi:hypothetical protein
VELTAAYTAWHGAYVKTLTPHTKVDTEAKNRSHSRHPAFRQPVPALYAGYQRRPYRYGHPQPLRSPRPAPDCSSTPARLIIHYRDEKSEHRGKPAGVHGIEVRWAILDQPPLDIKELVNSSFDTKPPLILEFEEHERGKRVYLCGAWEIEREGEKGPFGAIEEAIIP